MCIHIENNFFIYLSLVNPITSFKVIFKYRRRDFTNFYGAKERLRPFFKAP